MDILNGTRTGKDFSNYAANNADSFPEIEAIIKTEDDCPAPSESDGAGVILQTSSSDSIDIKYEFPELTPSVTKKRRGRPPSSKKALATPVPASISKKRKKDSSSKPSIAITARKRRPKEPVPSTSSSLPLIKSCTVKLIRLRLDTASNITTSPSVIPCNLLATLPLIHNYLEKEDLIICRLICKVWKKSVDNYLARKRRLCQPTSNTAIREPVPSTSSSSSPTKTCTVKPLIREDVKEEITIEDDKYKAATIWVDDIGTDEEEEMIYIKYQPPDESQLNTGPQGNLESISDEKTFLEALPHELLASEPVVSTFGLPLTKSKDTASSQARNAPAEKRFSKALPFLFAYFDKPSIIKCRAVCKSWRKAVNNCVTKNFLKASLSDLRNNSKLSNLLYNFPRIKRCEYYLEQMKNHSKNPFIGHAVRLDLPRNYPEADMRLKIRDFLKKFGLHIWTLYIDGNWNELDLDKCLSFITDDVLLNAPNIKNLIITKSLNVGTREIYGVGSIPFTFLVRAELYELSDSTSQHLLKCLSQTQLKILFVDSLKNVIQFNWPTLKELHLKPKHAVIIKDEEISRMKALQTWSKLELLGLDFTTFRLEFCYPDNWWTFNCILKCFQFAQSLNTIRFYSTPLWAWSPKKSDFSTLHKCPDNVKTIEVYDSYPEAASIAVGNYFDYSFLHCFPHVENLKIVQERIQGRFLHEIACSSEIVIVHKLIYDGRMYESNIWEVMPALQELKFGRRIYKRAAVSIMDVKRRPQGGLSPSLSEPQATSSSNLPLTTSPIDIDPSLKRFSDTLPLLASYLGKQGIIRCRSVCRSWRDTVDNYITNNFLKASLLDLQNKPKLSNFLQKFTDISAFDKIENHPNNPFIGKAVHLHLPEEWALRLIIPKFLKQFGQHLWTLHIDGDWDSFDSGPLLPFITDDVLLPAPNIKNLIISKSLSLGSLEIYGIERHPFEFLERVEISEVSDIVSKPLLKRLSETQLKILCLDTLDNFIHLEWATLKQLYLKDLRFKDELSIIKAPQLELLELGINMECWSSCKYEYSIFSNILNGLQSNTSLNAIRFSFYSTHLWINSQYKRSSNNFTKLQKCPDNIKTVEIYNACFRVRANYSEGFEFVDYSFLLCFPHVQNLKIVQENIPTQFLSKASRLNDTVKVHQLIYAGKMYESNIWEKIPALQELTFGRKIYKRSSFMRNPKLRIGTRTIPQAGPSQAIYRDLQNFTGYMRRTSQLAKKSTGGLPRDGNGSYQPPRDRPRQLLNQQRQRRQ